MAKIPESQHTTAWLIDQAIIKRANEKSARDYLGASILGEECDAALWFSIHKPVVIDDPRINRIFDMGNLIEDYVIRLLQESGIDVFTRDDSGEQFGFTDKPIAGHIDGVLTGLPESSKPHLFECKSMNSKNFALIQSQGLKIFSSKYWAQVQVYMKYMKLERCLFVAMNKDNQELYFERVKFEPMEAEYYVNRGKEIHAKEERPERKYNHKSHYKCKFCSYREICWIN